MIAKQVYLTFDDGPNEPYTSQILEILRGENVGATFFVCGKNVARYPETAKKIVQEGHVIGNHSYSHSFFSTLLGLIKKEIRETNQIIETTTGIRPKLLRPPWGLVAPWLKALVPEMKIILWDINSRDWLKPRAEKIIKRVVKPIRPGAIILLHDGKEIRGGDRSQTVAALPTIIKTLKSQNYIFQVLPEN